MGFEHSVNVDIKTAKRAETALEEFTAWARSSDPAIPDKVLGIGVFVVYERRADQVVDYVYGVALPEYFSEDEWPGPGQDLIHWPELPFFHLVPAEARRQLYLALERHDALDIWAELIREFLEADDRAMRILQSIFPGDVEIYKHWEEEQLPSPEELP